ncbi:hypothetical protein D1872_293580 [compost metagenome]
MREHGLIAVSIGDAFDTAQHFGENLVGQGRKQNTDRATGGVRKNIGGAVGDITQFIESSGNLATQRQGNLFRVTQKAADRHFGHTDAIGHILKYGSFLFHRPEKS